MFNIINIDFNFQFHRVKTAEMGQAPMTKCNKRQQPVPRPAVVRCTRESREMTRRVQLLPIRCTPICREIHPVKLLMSPYLLAKGTEVAAYPLINGSILPAEKFLWTKAAKAKRQVS